MSENRIFLDPTSEREPDRRQRQVRPDSLTGKTVGVLDISKARGDVFLDRLDRLSIGQPEPFLDQQRAEGDPRRHDGRAEIVTQLGVVDFLGQFPRHQPSERDPAILGVQATTEGKIEVGKLQLLMILAAVHPVTVVRRKT